ncbi:MAG: SDR family NAD(P)-dependent oxidoreductase, partial [Negativicoccus succinicivorans]|nr:SDR family NAD(P)-dependent oxidoreductase [Negativicoccus succinicivorans]
MKNYFDLSGKIALVTGGSSGLGIQLAKALARQGATVVVAARREEKLQETVRALKELGAEASYVVMDVMSPESIDQAVAEVVSQYQRIDILVNNAGVGASVPAAEQSTEDWRKVLGTNLDGVYYVA